SKPASPQQMATGVRCRRTDPASLPEHTPHSRGNARQGRRATVELGRWFQQNGAALRSERCPLRIDLFISAADIRQLKHVVCAIDRGARVWSYTGLHVAREGRGIVEPG